jgi:D-alanyl-lipoteichoic acid acyltransferase DltB (MBOAT superfamily)
LFRRADPDTVLAPFARLSATPIEGSLVLFNSYLFWAFYALVLLLYQLFGRRYRWQNALLLAASYVFYGCWDWRFLSLLWLSTIVDYFVGRTLARMNDDRPRLRRAVLFVSLSANLGLLAVFKYYGFFVGEFNELLTSVGVTTSLPVLNVLLPVGISFYTFQTMSYTVDVYRDRTKAARSLFDFALFVAFFPQLVAGPIERADKLLRQIGAPRVRSADAFASGLYLVLSGLFKKMFIADNLAPIANAVFLDDPASLTGLECLLGVYAFAFQIYGDFSGYSSIAQGIAKWMGFELCDNFRMPYFALTPSDFWKRWHISLSSWLRDYLYIPMGGNRGGGWSVTRNLLITMLLGGLWHGANWTFLGWGLLHGVVLCLYRPLETAAKRRTGGDLAACITGWRRLPAMVLMFHLVCLGWLLFRAESIGQASAWIARIGSGLEFTPMAGYMLSLLVFYAGPLLLFEAWLEYRHDLMGLVKIRWPARAAVYSYGVLMLLFFPPEAVYEFIYFQF